MNQASFEDGFLRGFFVGDLGTEDVNRTRSMLRLEMKLRGDVLNGSLIGMTVPGNRLGNALTHWVELRR